jgi:calcineurin-like phosphoesterase family protein
MNTFFWSDTHFFHTNLAEKFRQGAMFDGTVETHNAVLQTAWNRVVGKDDHIWIVGDAAMGTRSVSIPWMAENLNGIKHLIPGNHDNVHPAAQHKNPERAKGARELYEGTFTIHPTIMAGVTIAPELEGTIFSHFPWFGTPDHDDADRGYDIAKWYPKREDFRDGTVLVHGHTHGQVAHDDMNSFHVGVDSWIEGPLSLQELIKEISIARKRAS